MFPFVFHLNKQTSIQSATLLSGSPSLMHINRFSPPAALSEPFEREGKAGSLPSLNLVSKEGLAFSAWL